MAPRTAYNVTCWRDGVSWAVRIVQLNRTARAARLADVDAAARRVIGAFTTDDPSTVEVIVDLQVPAGIDRLLQAAAAARREADVVSVEAVALRRTLARRLTAHGYSVRDISELLGVSYARAKQLAGEPVELPVRAGRPAPPSQRVHSGYQHEAFFYQDDAEFLAGTLAFVQDAVALGQPIMVALVKSRMRVLQEALGPELDQVVFVDMGELGANPARIIPAWLDFVRQHPDRPVRGIGEPQWPGRRAEEVIECQLHEGLLNVAIDPDIPLWLRCPYDRGELATPIARAAQDSHPALVEVGEQYRGSTSYGGLHHVDTIFRDELPPAPPDCELLPFDGSDLATVRAHVVGRAQGAGLDQERSRALSTAVAEIAATSVRHGGGLGELRTWRRPDALVCQVTDHARLADPLVGRRTPTADDEQNRSLWLANQVSDLVQVRSTPAGSTARVFAWL